jgi:hypothetical protein
MSSNLDVKYKGCKIQGMQNTGDVKTLEKYLLAT